MLISPPPVAQQVVHLTLSSALDVLSAMITPAVLIMASGSLIMTTSSRLIRCVDRLHEALPQMKEVTSMPDSGDTDELRALLLEQIENLANRARLLQRALSELYMALATFVGTSIAIGVIALLDLRFAWISLVLGFIGAGLLSTASIRLMIESRIALQSTYSEMDYATRLGRRQAMRSAETAANIA